MEPELGAGEDPSRFACSKLTGAPFYDRGRSKSGDRRTGSPERLLDVIRRSAAKVAHSKPRKGKKFLGCIIFLFQDN